MNEKAIRSRGVGFLEYENSLNNYVDKKCDKTKSRDVENIFKNIINSKIQINLSPDSEGYRFATHCIKKIISCKPGRQLIKRLMKTGETLTIEASLNGKWGFSRERQAIGIINHPEHYYVAYDAHKGRIFAKVDQVCAFFHELVHALHWFENPELSQREKSVTDENELIHSEVDNGEEEHTIFGITKDMKGNYVFDPICENTFLKILGMPSRINHLGFCLKPGEKINASHALRCGLLDCLKSLLSEDPSLLNTFIEVKFKEIDDKSTKLTMLSAAIFYKREDIVDYLLSLEVDVNLPDDRGGALQVAVDKKNINAACQLVNRGAQILFQGSRDRSCLSDLILSFSSINTSEENEKITVLLQEVPWGDTLNATDSYLGRPPLMLTMDRGFSDAFFILLKLGADVNCRDNAIKNTVLMHLLYYFLYRKDDVVESEYEGSTSGDDSGYGGPDQVIGEFWKKFDAEKAFDVLMNTEGIDLNARNCLSESALHLAQELKNGHIITELKKRGAEHRGRAAAGSFFSKVTVGGCDKYAVFTGVDKF